MGGCLTVELSTIELDGDWDVGRAGALRQRLEDLLKQGRPLVIDLGRATFLDSTALGIILAARGKWENRGLAMALVVNEGTAYTVRNALHVLGIDRILPICSTRDQASALLRTDG
jgi:anti-sigma B factor antagonist